MKRLPPEKRRPISSRLEAVLADPQAICKKSCRICTKIPAKARQAALAVWDDFARSGEWPRYTTILQFLRANELRCGRERLKLLLAHRRYRILNRLVKHDLRAYGVDEEPVA